MLFIQDLMNHNILVSYGFERIVEVLSKILQQNLQGTFVVNDNKELSGYIHYYTLVTLSHQNKDVLNVTISDIKHMIEPCETVFYGSKDESVAEKVRESKRQFLVVVDQNNFPLGKLSKRSILLNIYRLEHGGMGSKREITEISDTFKKEISFLTDAEESSKLLEFMDQSPDMIHSVNGKGEIIEVSLQECEALGYTRQELCLQDVRSIYAPEILEHMVHGFEVLKKTGQMLAVESILITKAGKRIPVEINSTCIYNSQKQFVKTISILRNISDRKKAQGNVSKYIDELRSSNSFLNQELTEVNIMKKELEETNLKLSNANSMKDELVAMVAHDLKNPLCTIIGFVGLALEDDNGFEQEDLRNCLQGISNSADSALKLCKDLLDKYKIEKGFLEIYPHSIDFKKLIESSCLGFKFLADSKKISLSVIEKKSIGLVFCDPDRISQVLNNLISNALKWSVENSSVEIVLNSVEENKQGMLQVSVVDHGPGMGQDQVNSIFDKSEQLKRENKTGTGLGLSIGQTIVQLHGGRVWVQSEPYKNTEFSFTIPFVKAVQSVL